jgi:hypothetical protein
MLHFVQDNIFEAGGFRHAHRQIPVEHGLGAVSKRVDFGEAGELCKRRELL